MPPTGRSAPAGSGRWQFVRLDLPRGTGFGRHAHEEHQLVVVDRGVVALVADDATWAVPAGGGVWLPAGSHHEVQGLHDAAATFAYVRPPGSWATPGPGSVAVPPLARDLVAVLSEPGARSGARRERLEAVLLDAVADLRPDRLPVLLPVDAAARAVALVLLADPTDDRTIEELGVEAGASPRTLQRRFAAEAGLGFRTWRRRVRLRRAMAALEDGSSVTRAGHDAGFASTSAFIAAFRDEVGTTPAAWARADRRLELS